MNPTSPMNTATAAGATAIVTPVIAYVASLANLTMPPEVLSSIAVLIVAGAHYVGNLIAARNPQSIEGATP